MTCMTFCLSSLLRPIWPQHRRPSSNSGLPNRLSCSAPLWQQLLPQQKRIALKSTCWIQSTPRPATPPLPLTASPLGPSRDEVASSSCSTTAGQSPLELPVMGYWPILTGKKIS